MRTLLADILTIDGQIQKTFHILIPRWRLTSVEDGKKIMAALQTAIVAQEADTYTLFRRICPDCGVLRSVKDYTTRRIRTVFGTVEVRNPRWMLCRSCHPGFVLSAGNLPGPGDS